jgi:hypothetical protein
MARFRPSSSAKHPSTAVHGRVLIRGCAFSPLQALLPTPPKDPDGQLSSHAATRDAPQVGAPHTSMPSVPVVTYHSHHTPVTFVTGKQHPSLRHLHNNASIG